MPTPTATRLAYVVRAQDLVHRMTSHRTPNAEPTVSRDHGDPATAGSNRPKTSEFSRPRRIGVAQRVQAQ
jgi:hypothetical protein